MNGIEKITQRIQSDNLAEIRTLQEQTAEKCKAIADEGAQQAQQLYWDLLNQGTEAAQQRLERMRSTAAMEAKKEVLRAKQGLIDRAFEYAAEKLCALPEDVCVAFLAKLACAAAADGKGEIILSEEDRAAFGVQLCKKANALLADAGKPAGLTLAEETRATGGGFILSRGRIEVNCTFRALVMDVKDELAADVAGVLFE